jgi:hypothetical protein
MITDLSQRLDQEFGHEGNRVRLLAVSDEGAARIRPADSTDDRDARWIDAEELEEARASLPVESRHWTPLAVLSGKLLRLADEHLPHAADLVAGMPALEVNPRGLVAGIRALAGQVPVGALGPEALTSAERTLLLRLHTLTALALRAGGGR